MMVIIVCAPLTTVPQGVHTNRVAAVTALTIRTASIASTPAPARMGTAHVHHRHRLARLGALLTRMAHVIVLRSAQIARVFATVIQKLEHAVVPHSLNVHTALILAIVLSRKVTEPTKVPHNVNARHHHRVLFFAHLHPQRANRFARLHQLHVKRHATHLLYAVLYAHRTHRIVLQNVQTILALTDATKTLRHGLVLAVIQILHHQHVLQIVEMEVMEEGTKNIKNSSLR